MASHAFPRRALASAPVLAACVDRMPRPLHAPETIGIRSAAHRGCDVNRALAQRQQMPSDRRRLLDVPSRSLSVARTPTRYPCRSVRRTLRQHVESRSTRPPHTRKPRVARGSAAAGLSMKPEAAHYSSWGKIMRDIQCMMRTLRSFVGLHRFGSRPPRGAAWHTLGSQSALAPPTRHHD